MPRQGPRRDAAACHASAGLAPRAPRAAATGEGPPIMPVPYFETMWARIIAATARLSLVLDMAGRPLGLRWGG
jgi:hypothetical protein